MTDLADRIAQARQTVHAPWDNDRAEGVRASMRRKVTRRARARAAVAAALVAVAGGVGWRALDERPSDPPVAVRVRPRPDAPRVTPLDAASRARILTATATSEVVEVSSGSVRFEVPHRAERVFRVEANGVAVQVLGTTFTVARTAAGADVSVSEGRVRVYWAGRYADLGAGERGAFPRPEALPQPAPAPTAETPAPRVRPAPSGESLLARADAARAARDYERAAQLYRLALAGPRPDANAAFLLGRVLQENLGRLDEAADAFAQARRIAPRGALADDARARESACRAALHPR